MQKKQENSTHKDEKNQSIKTDPEMLQIIEFVDRDIRTTSLNIYYICSRRQKKARRDTETKDQH